LFNRINQNWQGQRASVGGKGWLPDTNHKNPIPEGIISQEQIAAAPAHSYGNRTRFGADVPAITESRLRNKRPLVIA
jgi:hypothetical protein